MLCEIKYKEKIIGCLGRKMIVEKLM